MADCWVTGSVTFSAQHLRARSAKTDDFDYNLGGACTAFAFKFGGSEFNHRDKGDGKYSVAVLFVCAEFEGGDFECPQLYLRIPFGRFSLLFIAAVNLIHCTGLFEGARFIGTGFIDANLEFYAGVDEEWFWLPMDQYKVELEKWTVERRKDSPGKPVWENY